MNETLERKLEFTVSFLSPSGKLIEGEIYTNYRLGLKKESRDEYPRYFNRVAYVLLRDYKMPDRTWEVELGNGQECTFAEVEEDGRVRLGWDYAHAGDWGFFNPEGEYPSLYKIQNHLLDAIKYLGTLEEGEQE